MTFRVVDVAGKPVAHSVKSFIDRKGSDFASSFTGLRGQVPCDLTFYEYVLGRDAWPSRYANLSGRAWADDPENWITLTTNPNLFCDEAGTRCGEPSYAFPEGYVLKGLVTPAPTARLWVHLKSAVGTSQEEAGVDPGGAFRMYRHYWPGSYFIYVMNDDGEIVYWSPLKITDRTLAEPLILKLPAVAPPTINAR